MLCTEDEGLAGGGSRKEEVREAGPHSLVTHPLGQHVLRLASPLPGHCKIQAPVESMSFGKVHFAQEPRKTEDSAAGTLKPRASGDSHRVGGRRAEPWAGHGPRVGPGSLWRQAPRGLPSSCGQHTQVASLGLRPPSLFRKHSVPKKPWIQ